MDGNDSEPRRKFCEEGRAFGKKQLRRGGKGNIAGIGSSLPQQGKGNGCVERFIKFERRKDAQEGSGTKQGR